MSFLRRFSSLLFVKRAGDISTSPTVDSGYDIRRISSADVSIDELEARGVEVAYFRKKAFCYIASDASGVVGSGWAFPESRLLARLGIGNGLYLGGFFVPEQFRGKGVYKSLLGTMCKELGPDYSATFAETSESNRASVKGLQSAGFVAAGTLDVIQLMGRINLRCALRPSDELTA